jgi:Domain of unknown function (DUF4265)
MSDSKVILTYQDENGIYQTESVWATKEGQYYRIDNIPFFAENIAYGDLVAVENDNQSLFFDELISPSEHSTIQIIFLDKSVISVLQEKLASYGCSWEGSHIETLIAVDIPRQISYTPIKRYLDEGERLGLWSYKEACLAHCY